MGGAYSLFPLSLTTGAARPSSGEPSAQDEARYGGYGGNSNSATTSSRPCPFEFSERDDRAFTAMAYGGSAPNTPEKQYTYNPPPYAQPREHHHRRRMSKAYSSIPNRYHTQEQVLEALREAGLESSNLIVGIDFTKSNEWTGRSSFGGRCLHTTGGEPNPYMVATSIIGHMLSSFDDDNLIPCFGFGDSTTRDSNVFSFFPDHRPCVGFEEALMRYKQITPYVRLAGPTSFAAIIETAMGIVEASGGSYHILLIIADGQVTRSVDTDPRQLSAQEEATIRAIVDASDYALSIIMVGVGDGPWDMMKAFDDRLPQRAFDNFQFVNYTEIASQPLTQKEKEIKFSVAALMEIPSQYNATLELGLLGRRTGCAPLRAPMPPPAAVLQADRNRDMQIEPLRVPFPSPYPMPYGPFGPHPAAREQPLPPAPRTVNSQVSRPGDPTGDGMICPNCIMCSKSIVLGCGHQFCGSCASGLQYCSVCRRPISSRSKLKV